MLPTEDHLAILNLYARYAHSADRGDLDEFERCWAADGSFEVPTAGRVLQGHAALREHVRSVAGSAGHLKHVTTDIWLRGAGAEVRGAGYLTVVAALPGQPPRITTSGLFEDVVVRAEGDWRFRTRVLHLDV